MFYEHGVPFKAGKQLLQAVSQGGHLGVLGSEYPRAGTEGIIRDLCVHCEVVRRDPSDDMKSGLLVRQDGLLLL